MVTVTALTQTKVSILYFSLSEATALNFLAPLGAVVFTGFLKNGTITLLQVGFCVTALIGVFLCLQPEFIFGVRTQTNDELGQESSALIKGSIAGIVGVTGGVVSQVLVLLTSNFWADAADPGNIKVALSAIRLLGTRVHPLTSVNYFGISVFSVTTLASIVTSEVVFPTSLMSWCLLVILGFIGFGMEYLLTTGLGLDDGFGATIMIYSQVVWAMVLDRLVWDVQVNLLGMLGIFVISISVLIPSLRTKLCSQNKSMYDELEMEEDYEARISLE